MKIYRVIAGLVLVGFLPQAIYAQAAVTKPISELPKPTLVQETRAVLLERGCVEVAGDAAAQTVAQPVDKPVHLYPNDWTAGKYVFCPENVRDTVTIKEGKVLFWGVVIRGLLTIGGLIIGYNWVVAGVPEEVKTSFYFVMRQLIGVTAGAMVFVIHHLSLAMEELLMVPNAANSLYVRRVWPFFQGLANIGFILALLYIAAVTILRLGTGLGSFLPKLVIGALLVNFSVLLGGTLIDLSRLIMAIEVRIISPASDLPLGLKILKDSQVFTEAFDVNFSRTALPAIDTAAGLPRENSLAGMLSIVTGLLVAGTLLIGLLYIVVGLYIRHIALVLLLIVSPLAYLALATPNLSGWATKWWSYFLKYVIYGPVALFMILLTALIPRVPRPADEPGSFTVDMLLVGTAVGFLWAAATVAKRYSGVGANQVMGFMNKATAFAKRNPKLALGIGAVAGGGVPLLLGGAAVGAAGYGAYKAGAYGAKRYVGRPIRDFVKESTRPLRKVLGLGEYSKYDPTTGELRKGETSAGQKAGIRLADPKARAVEKIVSGVNGAKDAGKLITPQFDSSGAPIMEDVPDIDPVTKKQKLVTQAKIDRRTGKQQLDMGGKPMRETVGLTKKEQKIGLHQELNTANLSNLRVMALLEGKQLEGVYEAAHQTGNVGVQRLLTQDKVAMRKMSNEFKAKIAAGEYDTDKEKFSEKAERTMRDISREDAAK